MIPMVDRQLLSRASLFKGNCWSNYMLIFICFGGKKYFHMKTIKGSCLSGNETPFEGNSWVKKIQGREIVTGISR